MRLPRKTLWARAQVARVPDAAWSTTWCMLCSFRGGARLGRMRRSASRARAGLVPRGRDCDLSHPRTDVRPKAVPGLFSSSRWTFDYAYCDFDLRLNSALEFTRKINASQKVQKSCRPCENAVGHMEMTSARAGRRFSGVSGRNRVGGVLEGMGSAFQGPVAAK